MELINALGVDLKILVAQLINFAILLLVLYKFGYKPIFKFLDERSAKIEKGVEDAQKAVERLEEIEENERDVMVKAKKEAMDILEQAKDQGEKRRLELIDKAKKEIKEIIDQEKDKIKAEKQDSLKQIKREIGDLVTLSVEKVLNEKINEKKDKDLIAKIVKNVK